LPSYDYVTNFESAVGAYYKPCRHAFYIQTVFSELRWLL
jgi:hypothetical protein